jgi:hypothetical protein
MSYLAKSMIFDFQELPLVIEKGIEAGFISGQAELEYESDGEWMILNVTLESSSVVVNGKRTYPQVDAPPTVAAIIDQRLNKEWADRVQDAVREQLASDYEDAMEARADARRDDRRMGV